jgi:predicted ATPase
MISEIDFSDVKQSPLFAYAAELKFFQQHKAVTFKPGLNILYGPNGCGKSSVLRMAALMLAAEQGGVSTITSTWVHDMFSFREAKLKGIKVSHDGQPIMYGNPRNSVGLVCGGAAFDGDFGQEGLNNIMSKDSTGLTTTRRLGMMLGVAQGKVPFPAKFGNRMGPKYDMPEAIAEMLKATIPKGQRTLIFDEPESGLAIPVQGNLFNLLFKAAIEQDLQIILATHSAFSLGLPGCNYIEMEPGYIEYSRNAVSTVHLRFELERLAEELKAKADEKKTGKAANSSAPADSPAPEAKGTKPAAKRKPAAKKTT